MSASTDNLNSATQPIRCGVVMPIAGWADCSDQHWSEILNIVKEGLEPAGYAAELVSSAVESSVIQKRIVQSLINDPVIVCDVSGRNPNVMFELGIRLAFDKPTVIIKDDATTFNFDISPIEHLIYPRTLRFYEIKKFQEQLAAKVEATHSAFLSDPDNYSCYLKHFEGYKPARSLPETEVSLAELIQKQFAEIRDEISNIKAKESTKAPVTNDSLSSAILAEARRMKADRLRSSEIEDQIRFMQAEAAQKRFRDEMLIRDFMKPSISISPSASPSPSPSPSPDY